MSSEKLQPIFNPREKFIEHADIQHEKSLEKKKFDFEYQNEFKDFFLNVFKEVNIDISDSLESCFRVPKDDQDAEKNIKSVYISPTSYLSAAITSKYPQERLLLDEKLGEKFKERIVRFSQGEEMPQHTPEELDEQITKAYLEKVDLNKLRSIIEKETDQAKKNLLLLIIQIINPHAMPKTEKEVEIKMAEMAPIVGQCLMSERHMLAYISGKHIKPGNGYINLILDNDGLPLMLEKIKLGDSHGCISLKPIRINGKFIPAGAIFSSEPDSFEPIRSKMKWFKKREGAINYVTKVGSYRGFKFLRMSFISVPEEIRSEACGGYYLYQQNRAKGYINYDWITPEIISEYAITRLELEGIK